MKRLATIALALLAVTSAADSRKPPKGITLPRGCRDRGCVRERVVSASSAGPTCSQSIQCAVTAGDKSGNWWALQSDGMMATGSSLTMTAAGSPGVSPLTFNGSNQKYTSGTVAYPTGSFSFVMALNVDSSTSATMEALSKWEGATLSYTLEIAGGVTPKFYVVAAGGSTGRADGTDISKGSWVCLAGMYTTGTGDVTLREYGVGNFGATATGGGVAAQTAAHRVAAWSGGNFFFGQSRGAFFTEKVLSYADVDRICAGAL